jgi:hypothetical protein
MRRDVQRYRRLFPKKIACFLSNVLPATITFCAHFNHRARPHGVPFARPDQSACKRYRIRSNREKITMKLP